MSGSKVAVRARRCRRKTCKNTTAFLKVQGFSCCSDAVMIGIKRCLIHQLAPHRETDLTAPEPELLEGKRGRSPTRLTGQHMQPEEGGESRSEISIKRYSHGSSSCSLCHSTMHTFACTCTWERDKRCINKANGFICLVCLAAPEIRSSGSRSGQQPGSPHRDESC